MPTVDVVVVVMIDMCDAIASQFTEVVCTVYGVRYVISALLRVKHIGEHVNLTHHLKHNIVRSSLYLLIDVTNVLREVMALSPYHPFYPFIHFTLDRT
jgi:hypothetical protein